MPLYSFECPVCGVRFDARVSIHGDTNRVTCPNGHANARRLFSPPTIVFKGQGFYVNDSRQHPAKSGGAD